MIVFLRRARGGILRLPVLPIHRLAGGRLRVAAIGMPHSRHRLALWQRVAGTGGGR